MKRSGKQPPPPDEAWEEEEPEEDGPEAPGAPVRMDKWLWAARLFKTRGLAAEACDAGHVKVDGVSVKPARPAKIGERIEAQTSGGKRIVVVRALSSRRGPAEQAALLFEDHSPPPPPKEPAFARWDRHEGRPTKRDRRQLQRLKGW